MIAGIDQVLLDLVVHVNDDPGIYARYSLPKNGQCLAEAKHQPLISDIVTRFEKNAKKSCNLSEDNDDIKRTPGGMIANSLRAAAWTMRQAKVTLLPSINMIGMVGDDTAADVLRQELRKGGVNPLLATKPVSGEKKRPGSQTGVCICLVSGKQRTMIAELGASRTMELHGRLAPAWPSWESRAGQAERTICKAHKDDLLPTIIVLSGFYAMADPEGSRAIAAWCRKPRPGTFVRPLLAVSMSAEWCCSNQAMQEVARGADILFANEPETKRLAETIQGNEGKTIADSEEALRMVARWKNSGIVIVTRGSESVLAIKAGEVDKDGAVPVVVPVPKIPPDEYVDDVGAGDSFMGGFLADIWMKLSGRGPSSKGASTSESKLNCSCCFTGCAQLLRGGSVYASRQQLRIQVAGSDSTILDDPVGHLLSDSEIQQACITGIACAAESLRHAGCQYR